MTLLRYNDTRIANEDGALIVPPEEVVELLKRMRAAGAKYVILIDITGSRGSFWIFREEIMPSLGYVFPARKTKTGCASLRCPFRLGNRV